jgi:hypothetical protein
MVSQFERNRMRVEVDLLLEIGLIVLSHVMVDSDPNPVFHFDFQGPQRRL